MAIKKRGQINLNAIVLISLILIAASGFGGYFLGKNSMKEYKTAIDEIFPAPLDEIFSIDGTIQEISGDSFKIETSSFERYIPGKERKMILLDVETNQDTQITESDLFATEELQNIEISISELKIGDYITITSEENIKNKNKFTATTITKLNRFETFPENLPSEISGER